MSVLFEVRFDALVEGLADLLPGLLFGKLGKRFPTIANLPAGELPAAIRQTLPDWQHQILKQMSSPDGLTNLNFGNNVISIQLLRTYPGWPVFYETISLVLDTVRELGLIGAIRRYSLRYQNVIDRRILPSTDDLRIDVRIGDKKPSETGFSVRGEYDVDGTRAVVQIATGVNFGLTVQGSQYNVEGTLIDVDAMDLNPSQDFLWRHKELLTILHEKEKAVFFDVLSPDAIQRLGPVWEDK